MVTAGPFLEYGEDGLEHVRFQALGAQCDIWFVAPAGTTGGDFVGAAVSWLQHFTARFSRFSPESVINRVNTAAGCDWVPLDAEAERMFALAGRIFTLTEGILDATALPLVRLWSYDAVQPHVPTAEEISEAAAKVGWGRIRLEPGKVYLPEAGMGLDFGCFGRKYAVDRIYELARAHGLRDFMLDFGHATRMAGSPPAAKQWNVGVEDAVRPGVVRMRLALNNAGVATSGDFLRFFEAGGRRYGHIIDMRTGYPAASGCTSVTVVAGSTLDAGILATTVYVLGPEEGLERIEAFSGAEGCVVCGESELRTSGFERLLA